MTAPASSRLTLTPQMSDNCWSAVLDALGEGRHRRVLEWGSGTSTLAFIEHGLDHAAGADREKLVLSSVEHDPTWFRHVAGDASQLLRGSGVTGEVFFVDGSTKLRNGPRSEAGPKLRLESQYLLYYDVAFSNWSFRAGLFSSTQPARHHVRRILHHVLARGWTKLTTNRKSQGRFDPALMQPIEMGELDSVLDGVHGATGCILHLSAREIEFWYYLLPPNLPSFSPRWSKDGMFWEFEDYVMVPVEPPFDLVVADGRARVSCIKRVLNEQMLSDDGYLFLHDANSDYYQEAIRQLDGCYFIDGSGVCIDGTALEAHGSKFFALHGASKNELRRDFTHELLVYRAQTP